MTVGLRRGRDVSVVVPGEKNSEGRSERSTSGGRASSASKISSISEVSFSRGASRKHRLEWVSLDVTKTYHVHLDHQYVGQNSSRCRYE